ncbi:hypothetical protein DSECCO2_382340 [anaerobic digester metagenome]
MDHRRPLCSGDGRKYSHVSGDPPGLPGRLSAGHDVVDHQRLVEVPQGRGKGDLPAADRPAQQRVEVPRLAHIAVVVNADHRRSRQVEGDLAVSVGAVLFAHDHGRADLTGGGLHKAVRARPGHLGTERNRRAIRAHHHGHEPHLGLAIGRNALVLVEEGHNRDGDPGDRAIA